MASTNPSDWTPMLWPAEWTAPETLRLVAGSPVDCLVLPHSASGAASWKPLEAEARRAGLEILAVEASGFLAPEQVWVVEGGQWPKIATRGDLDAVDAGPTGLPWIDSNGWRIELARALFPGRTPWVHFTPPEKPEVIRPEAYEIAAADCEAYGARWVLSLDRGLRTRLAAGDAAAGKTWQRLLGTVAYFRKRAPEAEMGPAGLVAALSDYSGDNQFLSHEFLNLIAREYVPVRILPKSGGVPSLDGLRLVVYLDKQPLEAAWKTALAEFVRAGGILVADRPADPGIGSPAAAILGLECELRSFGRGRVAVSREGFDDPWRLAADSHVLLGRANDLLRQANAGSMNVSYAAGAGRKRTRLHIVNYSGRPGLNPVTLTFLDRFRAARFRSSERPEPVSIPVEREYDRSAVYLPQFSVCATLELEA